MSTLPYLNQRRADTCRDLATHLAISVTSVDLDALPKRQLEAFAADIHALTTELEMLKLRLAHTLSNHKPNPAHN